LWPRPTRPEAGIYEGGVPTARSNALSSLQHLEKERDFVLVEIEWQA
jgi:hypothetical protein